MRFLPFTLHPLHFTQVLKQNLQQSGQAMVETVVILLGATIMLFATLQVVVLVMNDIISNDAAFAMVRSLCVATGDRQNRSGLNKAVAITEAAVLRNQIDLKTYNYVPTGLQIRDKVFGIDNQGKEIVAYGVDMNYCVKTMFVKLIDPMALNSYSLGSTTFLKRTARARMVKSQDELYYKKAYFNAQEF